MQSPVISVTAGVLQAGIQRHSPFLMDSSVMYSNYSQAFDMQLLLRPKKVAFWWNLLCSVCDLLIPWQDEAFFDVSLALGRERRRTKSSVQCLLTSSSHQGQSWAVWPMPRGMNWASKSKLAVTFKHFSHRLPAEKKICSVYSAAQCMYLSIFFFI